MSKDLQKTATQQFVEDAIKGRWVWVDLPQFQDASEVLKDHDFFLEIELLNPLFWQAVGKTRGWGMVPTDFYNRPSMIRWHANMHQFVDHLADGLSIEEALGKI